jgi:hypothetical protein
LIVANENNLRARAGLEHCICSMERRKMWNGFVYRPPKCASSAASPMISLATSARSNSVIDRAVNSNGRSWSPNLRD